MENRPGTVKEITALVNSCQGLTKQDYMLCCNSIVSEICVTQCLAPELKHRCVGSLSRHCHELSSKMWWFPSGNLSRDAALIITTRKWARTGIIFLIGHGRCSLHNHLQRKQCLLSIGIKDTITSGTQLDLLKNYIQTAMKRTRLMSTGVFYQ